MFPTVTVIIPTYNHQDFILETLDSVFAQTFKDYQVIVVNDGSPDDTAEVLRPLIQTRQIKYIHQTNAGQAAARNCGLRAATGEFVALLDDDDLWPSDKLQWQVEEMRRGRCLAVGGGVELLRDGRIYISAEETLLIPVKLESLFRGSPFISPGQVLLRRSAIESVGGFDESIWGADDLDLWMRLAKEGLVLKGGRCSLYYRQHSGNASRDKLKMLRNALRVIQKNLPLVSTANRDEAERDGFRWLYEYLGSPILSKQKWYGLDSLREAAFVLRMFWVPMMRDRVLLKNIALDLSPSWGRQYARSLNAVIRLSQA